MRRNATKTVQFDVEQVSSLLWNHCPVSRGMGVHFAVEYARKGCSPDNAACEGFFGRLKTELFYPRNWQSTSIEQFMQTVDSYIRWYNEKRIKISLGSLSPVEYRLSLGIAV